jgi:hypothetical protein
MASRVGIIVDGDGDYASLRRRFTHGYKIVKTDEPRGRSASATDIAHNSRKQILILSSFRCERVVVVLDFENRPMPYSVFVEELISQFASIQLPVSVAVAVPNRMIENWYLADIEFLSKQKLFLRDGIQQKTYEGKDGKALLKRLMRKGISYSETKHGPELFEILRFDVARKHSASLDKFLNEIRAG